MGARKRFFWAAVALALLAPAAARADTEPVRADVLPLAVNAYGVVHPGADAVLAAKVLARVVALPLREGAAVKAGDLVAELDHLDLDAELAVAEATLGQTRAALTEAEVEHARVQSLAARGSATTRELERASSARGQAAQAVSAAEAGRELVRTRLGYTRVQAPFDGRVVVRLAEVGELAAPGTPLVRIESVGGQELWADVPQGDMARVRVGLPARITVDGVAGSFEGRVTRIVPAADPRAHTFTVKVALDGGARVYTGMFGQVAIPYGSEPVLTVPATAVVRRAEVTGVYVAGADGAPVFRLVRPGALLGDRRAGDRQVILAGLSEGEPVLVDGQAVAATVAEAAR
ncbi:MAG: efflux RND transporter periplasmic adaptor subunit [Nitrospirae bacterium]|nr:efflux RND transporter periplasmic adaptor subunit [Nitrospirota bacterium]